MSRAGRLDAARARGHAPLRPQRPGAGERPSTSLEIAALAGVSQSTVSRALNGNRRVGAETRQRILDIAAALDYRVDLRASHLRTRQTGALTLLLFADDAPEGCGLNPFYLSMIGGITQAASRRGLDLIVSLQQLSRDWHADYLRSRRSDGLILLGYGDYRRFEATLGELVARRTPFVRWGCVDADQPGVSVGSDNVAGAAQATRHLLALGRRRIAFLGDRDADSPEFRARHRGYREALEEAGLALDPALQADADLNAMHAGAAAIERLFASATAFDAVVAASDQIALSAINRLHRAGHRVPESVAVVGFDDVPMSALASPALTTVQQDTRLAGECLVESLVAQIEGRAVASRMIEPRLVIRASCGAGQFLMGSAKGPGPAAASGEPRAP